MIENFLFLGGFLVAETKATYPVWVLPTLLRVVILKELNLMKQIGMPTNPQ